MIIIRECFTAKPGMASKLAQMMKSMMTDQEAGKVRVMTDLTGDFNTVVIETEMENLAEFEKRMREYRGDEEMKKKMSGYTDMYMKGGREIFQILE